jgi:hypothetical protein
VIVTMMAADVRAVAANQGVNVNDQLASRVLVRNERGSELLPVEVWPADTDPFPEDARPQSELSGCV